MNLALPSSVLVRLNEAASEVLISVDIPGTQQKNTLVISTIRLSDYADEAACFSVVGKVLLDSLRVFATGGMDDAEDAEIFAIVEDQANKGNPEAMRAMVGLVETAALRKGDLAMLDQVESWYLALEKLGDPDASNILINKWPEHKNMLRDMIMKKQRGANG